MSIMNKNMNKLFEEVLAESLLEDIRLSVFQTMLKFREISEEIRPTFESLDTWKTTNHSKLDESQKLHDDFGDLNQCIESLRISIVSFSNASKPIQNITGANTLISTIAGYVISINSYVKTDGFEVDDENDANVFSEMQNKYFEFIAEMKVFFAIIRKEGFEPPNVTDVYNNAL